MKFYCDKINCKNLEWTPRADEYKDKERYAYCKIYEVRLTQTGDGILPADGCGSGRSVSSDGILKTGIAFPSDKKNYVNKNRRLK